MRIQTESDYRRAQLARDRLHEKKMRRRERRPTCTFVPGGGVTGPTAAEVDTQASQAATNATARLRMLEKLLRKRR